LCGLCNHGDVTAPLHYHELGRRDGPALLALHGIGGHGQRWRRLADRQLAGCRVIAPDLRGHGESLRLPPWTLEQHAADLLSLLDHLGVSGLPVMGHSFGAAVAIYLARLAPQRVTKLILLDPAIGLSPEFANEHVQPVPKVFRGWQDAVIDQRKNWPGAPDEVIKDEVAANVERLGDVWTPRYSHPTVNTAWSEMCRSAQLPPPTTPTLLVSPLRERFVRPAFVEACRITLGDRFELASLDCGHMIYLERPVELGSLLKDFLGRS
jgi:lipase